MTYRYKFSYDIKVDEFYGVVEYDLIDEMNCTEEIIFEIETTQEMKFYLINGHMKHLDDVEGLTKFLKDSGIIQAEDLVVLREVS